MKSLGRIDAQNRIPKRQMKENALFCHHKILKCNQLSSVTIPEWFAVRLLVQLYLDKKKIRSFTTNKINSVIKWEWADMSLSENLQLCTGMKTIDCYTYMAIRFLFLHLETH